MNIQDVILKPIITEKTTREASLGKYAFCVAMAANKMMIKRAIEDKFSVNVVGVTTIIVKGKSKRAGKRSVKVIKTSWKKAISQLKQGQKIDIFGT